MLTISLKNHQVLDKNSITTDCNYAQLSGVYYNKEGFNKVTDNVVNSNGVYDSEKYVFGKETTVKNGSYVNYEVKPIKKLGDKKNSQLEIKNKSKNNNTNYGDFATISTVNVKVKDNVDIVSVPKVITQKEISNKNIVISKKPKDINPVNEIKKNIIRTITDRDPYTLNPVQRKNNTDEYTYNSSISINWSKYVNKAYFIHSKHENSRTLSNLKSVGLTEYENVYYKTELTFDKYKYYKSAAFLEAIEDAYNKQLNSIIIIKDDVKFIDNQNIIESFLENSTKHNISILNPNDIATDCVILRKEVIQFIHNLNIDKSQLNWHIMFVKQVLAKFTPYKAVIDICLHLIDYVVPFVDGNDIEWQKIHDKYTIKETGELNTVNRFRSWNNFQYVFRCIEQNCKFIDNVYLIVMQESQIPSWINTKNVNIVYHKDFIPEKHLPCFSSSMIETYMTNIKDISEHFLYANDDLFVINRTTRKDWFENGTPKVGMTWFTQRDDYFSSLSFRSWQIGTSEFSTNKTYRTTHGINGILKSVGDHLHSIKKEVIEKSVSRFRSSTDLNQYMYTDYVFALSNYNFKKSVSEKYLSVITEKSLDKLRNLNSSQVLCLNDCIKDANEFESIKNKAQVLLYSIINKSCKYEITEQVDFVFPYVTMDDPDWQVLYKKYYPSGADEASKGIQRFRDYGTLKYLFRGIEKYLPWINKVHMIVMSDSQVPKWINRKNVNIIYHKDFIPEKYLPLFNSSAIEMYLWNLPGVSDNFIYGNDDVFIINKISKSDFCIDGKLIKKMAKHKQEFHGDILRRYDYDLIYGTNTDKGYVLRDEHGLSPYNKTYIKQCFDKYKEQIEKSISKFRTPYNYNKWIFDLYDIKNELTINYQTHKCLSTVLNKDLFKKVNLEKYTEFCVNDSGDVNNTDIENLNLYLNMKFPNKTKYEI